MRLCYRTPDSGGVVPRAVLWALGYGVLLGPGTEVNGAKMREVAG